MLSEKINANPFLKLKFLNTILHERASFHSREDELPNSINKLIEELDFPWVDNSVEKNEVNDFERLDDRYAEPLFVASRKEEVNNKKGHCI